MHLACVAHVRTYIELPKAAHDKDDRHEHTRLFKLIVRPSGMCTQQTKNKRTITTAINNLHSRGMQFNRARHLDASSLAVNVVLSKQCWPTAYIYYFIMYAIYIFNHIGSLYVVVLFLFLFSFHCNFFFLSNYIWNWIQSLDCFFLFSGGRIGIVLPFNRISKQSKKCKIFPICVLSTVTSFQCWW